MEGQKEIKCEICSKSTSKYKCPSCSIKYVPCYKLHRETSCQKKVEETSVELEVDKQGNVFSRQVLFPTDDTVMPKTLEKFRTSKELLKLLQNPHLRDIIKEVDSHSIPKLMMDCAMREPIFTEFADVCLKIVEPPEEVVLPESEDET